MSTYDPPSVGAEPVAVTVSVDESHRRRLGAVARELTGRGMAVAATLDALGAITGTVDADRLDGLRSVPGVAAVEPARRYRLPPPGARPS